MAFGNPGSSLALARRLLLLRQLGLALGRMRVEGAALASKRDLRLSGRSLVPPQLKQAGPGIGFRRQRLRPSNASTAEKASPGCGR